MNDSNKATAAADELLELLIKHQPEIINPIKGGSSEESGRNAGEFIAGLRARLIDMYNLTPRV